MNYRFYCIKYPVYIIYLLSYIFCFKIEAHDLSLNASQESQYFYLIENKYSNESVSSIFNRTSLMTKGNIEFSENIKFKLDSEWTYTQIKNQSSQAEVFSPLQLGLSLSSSHLDFFVGGFSLIPDGPDINNIFDVIDSKDYRQVFNTKPIGNLGINSQISYDNHYLKFFYIPLHNKSILPDMQSAFLPRTEAIPITSTDGTFILPDIISYQFRNENIDKVILNDNFGAYSKLSFDNFDFSFFYYSGISSMPKIKTYFDIDVTSIEPLKGNIKGPIQLDYEWYKSIHSGFSASFLLKDWILKLFYKEQSDETSEIQKSKHFVATIENSLAISKYTLRYFAQINRIWSNNTNQSELETLSGFFSYSSLIGFYADFDSFGLITGGLIYNEKEPGTIINLNYEYKFNDHLKSKLSLNTIDSGGGILANAYDKIDNVSLIVNYLF